MNMIGVGGEYDADFFILLFLVAPVALLGMVGNIICLVILKRNSYNVVTVKLFQATVIANTLYIAFVIVSRLHEILSAAANNMPDMVTAVIEAYVKVAFIPLCHTIIVYLIVLVTLDRYTTVFKPCGIAYLCHGDVAICRVILGIVGLAIIVNLPHFFEMKISYVVCDHSNLTLTANRTNMTSERALTTHMDVAPNVLDVSQSPLDYPTERPTKFEAEVSEEKDSDGDADMEMDVEFDDPMNRCRMVSPNGSDDDSIGTLGSIQPFPSDFVHTPAHSAYRVFELLATELVPVVLITVMNARLICVMQHLMVHRAQNIHAQRRSEYRAVLVTLVILVSVFVVCEMPIFTLKLVELVDKLFDIRRASRTTYVIFYSVGQLFVQISASTNFIVYFCSNPVHRQQLWSLLRCDCATDKDTDVERGAERSESERRPHLVLGTPYASWRRCWRFLRPHDAVTTSVETESVYARIRAQRYLYNQYFRDTQIPSPLRRGCYFPTDTVAIQHTYQIRFQPILRM